MSAIIRGGVSGVDAEVEANTRALKVRTHPVDVLGSYQIELVSGSMAAGLAGAAPIFAVRWTDAAKQFILRRLALDARCLGTAFTAGVTLFEFVVARGFSASDTGGTGVSLSGNNAKRKTAFATSLIGDLRIASTGTLTAGTRTLDANAMYNVRGHVPATATGYAMVAAGGYQVPGANTGAGIVMPVELFAPDFSGEWPLVLVQNEGFIIRATVPATGVWDFSVTMEWSEVAANAF